MRKEKGERGGTRVSVGGRVRGRERERKRETEGERWKRFFWKGCKDARGSGSHQGHAYVKRRFWSVWMGKSG